MATARPWRIAWWAPVILIAAFAERTPNTALPVNAAQSSCTVTEKLTQMPQLPEASSLALSRRTPGTLWAINDSGVPRLFRLTTEGRVISTVTVAGAEVRDWEDVSVGPCPDGSCVYLADIGDNRRSRDHVVFYRFPEPDGSDRTSAPAETYNAVYPDGAHDAEAAFVTSAGVLFVVTKDDPATLYRVESPWRAGATLKMQRVATLSVEPPDGKRGGRTKFTDGEASPDGRWVVLRTGDRAAIYSTQALISAKPATPMLVDLGGLREPQGEGVALASDGTLYVASEGGGGGSPGTFARLSCKLTP